MAAHCPYYLGAQPEIVVLVVVVGTDSCQDPGVIVKNISRSAPLQHLLRFHVLETYSEPPCLTFT